MGQAILTSIIGTIIIAIILTGIMVYKALKNPEKFQKESEATYKQINNMKSSVFGNTLSWEEAKKQAAEQLELERQKKEEKKAAKRKK